MSGNLSAWGSGDPGPQGWFIIEPWDIGVSQEGLLTSRPQLLSEIRLELTYSEGTDLKSIDPYQRTIVFHVDQLKTFSQKVGRQHQQNFFERLVRPEFVSALSRSIFELSLEAPATFPTLLKLSQNTVCVNQRRLENRESILIQNGSKIGLGSQATVSGDTSPTPFVEFAVLLVGCNVQPLSTVSCVPRQREAVTMMDGQHAKPIRGGGYEGPLRDGCSDQDSVDCRPGTAPQFPLENFHLDQRATKAVLQCVFSSSKQSPKELWNAAISLIPNQMVTIGRMHQVGFFEKLLPDQESLSCISRSHVTACLHSDGRLVDIENLSQNSIKVNETVLQARQRHQLMVGTSLKFMALEQTLLEFKFELAW